jgi:hypothetical protein
MANATMRKGKSDSSPNLSHKGGWAPHPTHGSREMHDKGNSGSHSKLPKKEGYRTKL